MGFISIMAQCVETHQIPIESVGRDLHIRQGHLCVRVLLHGVICVTKSQPESKCFCHILSFFS